MLQHLPCPGSVQLSTLQNLHPFGLALPAQGRGAPMPIASLPSASEQKRSEGKIYAAQPTCREVYGAVKWLSSEQTH